jgi:DNA-binding response OmpR family regulator
MTDRVLVVEDDLDLATLIKVNLGELGLTIDHCADGQEGCDAVLEKDYRLILLDVMLPSMNGLDICRKVRDNKPEQATQLKPTLALTLMVVGLGSHQWLQLKVMGLPR